MIFMDPKTDIGFKKLFGSNKRKNILISFLNSILERKEGEKIVTVDILDPNNNRDSYQEKFSIVDIRCKDQADKMYIIEMQLIDKRDFLERSQYYAALAFSRQLRDGEKYHQLTPVIFVGVLNFSLFTSPEYLSHHLILNSKTHEHALHHLEFHFLELAKFNKKVHELDGLVDKWIYILKNACNLSVIPQELKKPNEIEQAMESLEQGTWTDKEIDAYEKYWDRIRNESSALETAVTKAMQCVALKMLQTHSESEIAQITGLSLDEIEKLKRQKKN